MQAPVAIRGVPVYGHSCVACRFIGVYEWRGDVWDLYYCPDDALGPTIVARWSSAGGDYVSGAFIGRYHAGLEPSGDVGAYAPDRTHPLAEAQRRVCAFGWPLATF